MTKLTWTGKLLGAGLLIAAGLLTMTATAFSGGTPATPQKKVQIKIIIDGKEIDITDAKLLEHLQAAAPKKDPFVKKDVVIKAVVQDGQKPAEGGIRFNLPFILVGDGHGDPRIEALVKQAEAIKPGSGADVRKALQGAPKKGAVRTILITGDAKMIWDLAPGKTPPPPAPPKVQVNTGKKIIILRIDDGKPHQIETELKKLLEKGDLGLDKALPSPAPKVNAKKEDAKFFFEIVPDRTTKPGETKTPADLEALRRQLERITADLQDLRKQLNAGSKK